MYESKMNLDKTYNILIYKCILNFSTMCCRKCGTNFHYMLESSVLRLSSISRVVLGFFGPNSHVPLSACGLLEICETFQPEDLVIFDTHFYDISSYFLIIILLVVTKLHNLYYFSSCITYIVFKLHNLHCL